MIDVSDDQIKPSIREIPAGFSPEVATVITMIRQIDSQSDVGVSPNRKPLPLQALKDSRILAAELVQWERIKRGQPLSEEAIVPTDPNASETAIYAVINMIRQERQAPILEQRLLTESLPITEAETEVVRNELHGMMGGEWFLNKPVSNQDLAPAQSASVVSGVVRRRLFSNGAPKLFPVGPFNK